MPWYRIFRFGEGSSYRIMFTVVNNFWLLILYCLIGRTMRGYPPKKCFPEDPEHTEHTNLLSSSPRNAGSPGSKSSSPQGQYQGFGHTITPQNAAAASKLCEDITINTPEEQGPPDDAGQYPDLEDTVSSQDTLSTTSCLKMPWMTSQTSRRSSLTQQQTLRELPQFRMLENFKDRQKPDITTI